MKPNSLPKVAFLTPLLALSLGQAPATKPAAQPDWGKEVEGFRLAASVDKARIDGDQRVIVHVRLGTTGSNVARFPAGPLEGFSCRVTLDGKPCALTSYGSLAIDGRNEVGFGHQTITAAPGADYTYDFPCSRAVDMTMFGKYTIFITREIRLADGKTWATLESKPIEIEVVN